MTDPFLALRRTADRVEPAQRFADELRARLTRELGLDPTPGNIDLGRRRPMNTRTDPDTPAEVGPEPSDPNPVVVQFQYPHLVVQGGQEAVAFYQEVFGATVIMEPFIEPDGRIGHIELDLGGQTVSLADEYPEYDIRGPRSLGGTPVSIGLRVPTPSDVDRLVDHAVARGAEVVFAVQDQFYGERAGRIRDPWGHEWMIAGKIEDLTIDEMQARFAEETPPT